MKENTIVGDAFQRNIEGPRDIAAIIFDVDGTLYNQGAVRRNMAVELISAHCLRPAEGFALYRFLSAYRKAQEKLRGSRLTGPASELQFLSACQSTRTDPARGRAYFERWFHSAPLKHIRAAVRPALVDFLSAMKSRGLKLGVLSDYPADSKLAALGIVGFFDAVVCADDAGVEGFKPDPSGLLLCAEKLGVAPPNVLYIGDRPEVDAECAHRAGAAAAILQKNRPRPTDGAWLSAPTFASLESELMRRDWIRTR